jgi:hypothetical protein
VDPTNRLVADAQDDYDHARQAGAAPLDDEQQARIRALTVYLHPASG